jgi:hypothetical protein
MANNKKENTGHGLSHTVEYAQWSLLKKRCYNKDHSNFHLYGAKGIKVCDRWIDSFPNFLEDMGERPSRKHCIMRRDLDGDYSPENCYWGRRERIDNLNLKRSKNGKF